MTQTTVAIGTSSTTILNGATVRQLLILVNDSDTAIYISFGSAASVNSGIRLNANGGNLLLDDRIPPQQINGIHGGTGSKNLLLTYV